MKEYVVGRLEELEETGCQAVQIGNLTLAVFRIDNEVFAVPNRCQHKGGSLCDGEVDRERKVVRCPWHFWDWSLETGHFDAYPKKRMKSYPVNLVDGEIRVVI